MIVQCGVSVSQSVSVMWLYCAIIAKQIVVQLGVETLGVLLYIVLDRDPISLQRGQE